jgi:hypothetical protein
MAIVSLLGALMYLVDFNVASVDNFFFGGGMAKPGMKHIFLKFQKHLLKINA